MQVLPASKLFLDRLPNFWAVMNLMFLETLVRNGIWLTNMTSIARVTLWCSACRSGGMSM
eukprot:15352404-Ditylum_brightwellii.AAC.1